MKRPKQETQWVSGFGLVVSMPTEVPAGVSGLLGYAYLVVAGTQPDGSLARLGPLGVGHDAVGA